MHFNSEEDNGFLHDISVTLIDKTDGTNPIKNTTGDISSKRWHLMALNLTWLLNYITCFYILLVPCIGLLLIIITILIVVVIASVITIPYDEQHAILISKTKLNGTMVMGIMSSTVGIAMLLLLSLLLLIV